LLLKLIIISPSVPGEDALETINKSLLAVALSLFVPGLNANLAMANLRNLISILIVIPASVLINKFY